MTFGRPDLLWLAWVLPALTILATIAYYRRRKEVARRIGQLDLIERIGGAGLLDFPTARLILMAPAALLIGLAAASPQWGTETRETHGRSLDLAIVLDLSKSMLARDIEPDRLERQRLFANRLIRELAGDRIGLVAFAGRAYNLSPLTTDHSALLLYIDALDPDIISQGGSSHASAIQQGTELLRDGSGGGGERVMVLITDGEAHDDESAVISAAEKAAANDIRIYTVGVGTPGGAPVPDLDTYGRTLGYKRDPETDAIVISKLDRPLLERVAAITDGSYTPIDRPGATDALVSQIKGLQRAEGEDGTREVPRERVAWFIALALGLITIDSIAARRPPSRRTRRVGALVSALLLPPLLAFGIGDLERGNRLYRQGRYAEAIEAYQSALEGGNDSPILHYNLGTALLQTGQYGEAEEHLRRALAAEELEHPERVHYNLGNRYLSAGRRANDPRLRGELLDAAAEAYRDALRLDPGDLDAKWNLELALREQDQVPPMAGDDQDGDPDQGGDDDGTGGADGDQSEMNPPPGSAGDRERDQLDDPGAMSQAEAERILSAIEQAERELQRSKLRKGKRDTPVARDW